MRKHVSLAPRLIISLVVLITVVSIVLAGTVIRLEYRRMIRDLQTGAATTADYLARSLVFPAWNLVLRELRVQIEMTLQDPAVHGAVLRLHDVDPPLIAMKRGAGGRLLPEPPEEAEDLLLERREIIHDGRNIAALELFFSKKPVTDRILGEAYLIASIVLAMDGTLGLALFLILRRTILKPLDRIERWALDVSIGETPVLGNDDFRTGGEIASLRSSIARMVVLLDERYKIIETREREIRKAFDQKEALLKELFHRTRNSLQLVSSMILLRGNKTKIPGVRDELLALRRRILSIALVQDQLYEAADLSSVDLGAYLRVLTHRLANEAETVRDRIRVSVDSERLPILIDAAVPIGLIVCELVSNSLDHAFPADRTGTILVRLARSTEGFLELAVGDDGAGPKPGFDPRTDAGLGLDSVFALGELQLGGSLGFDFSSGFLCRFRFKADRFERRI